MIFTFYKAQGLSVGGSLVEEDKLELAKELMEKAKVGGGAWVVGPPGGGGVRAADVAAVLQVLAGRGASGMAHGFEVLIAAQCRAQPPCPHPPTTRPRPQAKGVQFVLPTDVVVADKFAADAEAKVVPVTAIPDGWMVR